MLITTDIVAVNDSLPFLAMGAEGRIGFGESTDLFLRAGVNTRAVSDLGGTRNFALGSGVRLGNYQVDYAFSPFGDLGTVHRISASLVF